MLIVATPGRVAIWYGAWSLVCVGLAAIGTGDGKEGHLLLAVTGAPLALLSFHVLPNGSTLATAVAGICGVLQWCLVTEGFSRWDARKRRRT
jgi:hypothetical protein